MTVWQIILYILAIILVLYLCYVLSKFVAKKMSTSVNNGTKIKIIDRVALGTDKGLAICLVCERYYLIGIATQNVKILAELDPQFFTEDDTVKKPDFASAFMNAMANKGKNKNQ